MKNFYDFNLESPQERQEREKLFPELSKFHIALREELSEDEYSQFYRAEKESIKRLDGESKTPYIMPNQAITQGWIQV